MKKEPKFVKKSEVKKNTKKINEIFPIVQKEVKEKYKKSFSYSMVGSAKRNLVVQLGESPWDVDYQILLQSPVFEEESAFEIKKFFRDSFQKHFGEEYSVKISTSVITICLEDSKGKHALKSYDVAILKSNLKTNKINVLKDKDKDTASWEELSSKEADCWEKRKQIKGSKKWEKFRKIYLVKKGKNISKGNEKSSLSIYLEAVKETMDG